MRIGGERPAIWAAEVPIGCDRGAEYRSGNAATSRSSAAWLRHGRDATGDRGDVTPLAEVGGEPNGPGGRLRHWVIGWTGTEGWSASPPRTATARAEGLVSVPMSWPASGTVGKPGIGTASASDRQGERSL